MFLFLDFKVALLEPITGWPLKPFTGISIFDWPEEIQTSPISTLFNLTGFPSEMVII